jgi:hypothetical protein
MPSITYFIRFTLKNPKPGIDYEEQEHLRLEDAFKSFRLFAEPDSRWMYKHIELTEYNWEGCTDTIIASMDFAG